ncbi:Hypothetical predicted protein [Olea europaea subsp. europaea]|uniref:Transmembrane protein n=1 Tax=Olea europaea subsp. europaea TaxID=158383 RepID=A0A8S0T5F8_OLEEU|nr:Hypothetical predicted protein [Olea europaea subsp. europaea]
MQPDLGRQGCRHRCRPLIATADELTKWTKTRWRARRRWVNLGSVTWIWIGLLSYVLSWGRRWSVWEVWVIDAEDLWVIRWVTYWSGDDRRRSCEDDREWGSMNRGGGHGVV